MRGGRATKEFVRRQSYQGFSRRIQPLSGSLTCKYLGVCEEAELPRFLKENPTSLRFSNTNGTILHCEISEPQQQHTHKKSKDISHLQHVSSDPLDVVATLPGAEYTWFERDVQIYEDKKLRIMLNNGSLLFPPFSWYLERDGELRRLVPSSRIQIHLETLTILQINPEDTGIYTCHVTNSILQDSARFDILVVPELEVVLSPTQQRARKGDNITLTCSTRGKIESVSWFRNGYRIQLNNQRYRYSTDQSILNIFNLEEDEGGIYQCFVNTANQTKQSAAVVLIQDSAPEIVERFTGSTLIPGQFLSLKCVGRGRPPPRFIWELDGFKIQLGDRYRQSQYVTSADDVMSQLNLTHVTDRDGGLYSCRAENTAGQTSHSEQIRVFGPPYIRDVGPVSGVEGSQLRVQCPVSGYPIDKITWEKDGGPVVSSSALQVYNNGTMIFRAGNKGTDPGEYTCTATTIGSSYSRTIQINIVVPPRMIEFSFYDLQEGMRTAVTCQTVDGELPIKFSWFRDGERVQDGDGETVSFQQTTYSSTLFIQKLDRKHTGKYTCTATNMAGEDSRSADLLVNVPPEWIVEPKNVEITAGEQISVPCSAFGVPEPRIIWEREGSNGKMNPQISSRTGLLDIPGADETLEGEYTCRVENGVEPSIMKTIRIDVKSPPRFRRRDQERRINRGSEEILECSAEGDPKIEYIWSRDGRIINPLQFKRFSIREENTTEGEISLLRVHRVTEEDSGEFRCEGINGYGRDTLNFHLIILDVPGVPANLSVGEISSRSGTLSWEPPFSGNSGILHYTVHSVQGSGTGAVNEITVSGQSRSLIIRSLTPGKDYSLTVRAHNAIGPSNSSKPVSFTTLEEAPTGRVRIISLTARSSSSLKLVWESPPQSLWNSQQLGYTISYRLQESRADYELMNLPVSSDTQFSILLESLEKYRTYEVLIETWNLVGRGEKSVPYLATTLEDVPTGSPQNVRCEPKSSRSLIFSWDLPTLRCTWRS
ncbi:Down syndrome cell adhesion molecule-like protein 1 [Eurytemora carolleeae]|uniref:Down syndrome cell adhesion molecule-like protein 1 n=1 Tax=Eurytemora carolleeae TaxID=1294199 RepID=UPI000C78076B|nr:Down syndrome cell adhesion molecule-like protein 1 [Eurytemora carolleeae]|eukprot:XP_023349612.1 Down syndrome cell adhesion molecule-like protein 1 [Eurytemora affinis]